MSKQALVTVGIIALLVWLYMQGFDLKIGKDFEVGVGRDV